MYYRNPFCPKDDDPMIGNEDALNFLQDSVKDKVKQTLIMGVEGVGKSELLKSLTDLDFREQILRDQKILIAEMVELNAEKPPNEVLTHLCNAIHGAIEMPSLRATLIDLLRENLERKPEVTDDGVTKTPEMKIKDILSDLSAVMAQSGGSGDSVSTQTEFDFGRAFRTLSGAKIRVFFLVDAFDRFVMSSQVKAGHHDALRSVLNNAMYLVATNYDLKEDSLHPEVRNSYFLPGFSDNCYTVRGLVTEEEANAFIDSKLKPNDPIRFSPKLRQELYEASGGIPQVLNWAAKLAYQQISRSIDHSEDGVDIYQLCLEDEEGCHLLENWSMLMTEPQIEVLYQLAIKEDPNYREGYVPDGIGMGTAAYDLMERGILRAKRRIDENGNRCEEYGKYEINSKLYERFCQDPDRLRVSVNKSPWGPGWDNGGLPL